MTERLFIKLLIVVLVLFSGCSKDITPPLRLGTNVWPGYEPLYLARDKNFLNHQRVHLVEYSNSSQVISSFRNGLIDAAALTLDEILLLLESGEKITIILVMDISDGADAIIGNQNLKNLADIKGRRVGVEGNALGAYMVTRALETVGLDRKAIKIVQMGVDEHEKAFKDKQVDAVVTFEPVSSKLMAAGGKLLFDSRQIPGEVVDVMVVRNDYLQRYPETINHLTNAWNEALNYFKQHPRDAARILGKRMKLDVDQTLIAYEGLALPGQAANQRMLAGKPEPLLLGTAKKLAVLMSEQGLLSKVVDVSSLFNNTLRVEK